jgi:hypothetical protein
MWFALVWIAVVALLALGMTSQGMHKNHDQSDFLKDLNVWWISFKDYIATYESETAIRAIFTMQYYGIIARTLSGGGGQTYSTSFVPAEMMRGISDPKFENGICYSTQRGVVGRMMITHQFEADIKSTDARYDLMEFRFEIPYGDVMSSITGDGYVGYKNTIFQHSATNDEFDDNAHATSSPKRQRCPLPHCLVWSDIDWYDGEWGSGGQRSSPIDIVTTAMSTSSMTPSLAIAQFDTAGRLFHRRRPTENSSVFIDSVVDNPGNVQCGCSGESPPRIACVFSPVGMTDFQGVYRLDLDIRYPIHPVARRPSSSVE